MTSARITIRNTTEVVTKLNGLRLKALEAGKAGVKTTCNSIFDEVDPVIPRATGALASSLYYETEALGSYVIGTVGHGGAYNRINPRTGKSTDSYAVERHELSREGFINKWLERAVVANSENYAATLATSYRSLFNTGVVGGAGVPDKRHK